MTSTDSFLYFAYGSNMSARRLRAPNRAPSATPVSLAYLAGYRLVFDKVSTDLSSKADCELTGNLADRTYGGLFRVSMQELGALDRAEGATGSSPGYRRVTVVLESATGPVEATTYLANASHKRTGLVPYDWYVQHVLVGARDFGLPADYIAQIASTPSRADDNGARAAMELAIYCSP